LTNDRVTEIFDFLICSSGLHCKPRLPILPGIDNYQGVILHSADYRSRDDKLLKKKVVILGNSYSGVEIASHIVGHAKTVTNIFKRPYLVLPRLLRLPYYENEHDNNNSKTPQSQMDPEDIEQEKKGNKCFRIIPIDLIFGRELTFGAKTPAEERENKIKLYSTLCPHQTNKEKSLPSMYYELNNDDPIREAVTDNYYPYIMQKKIIPIQSDIKTFEKNGIVLTDGSFVEADAIIFCTG
jgi:cation diffusion facilitator CzcD-associated flavoprotein CzcO